MDNLIDRRRFFKRTVKMILPFLTAPTIVPLFQSCSSDEPLGGGEHCTNSCKDSCQGTCGDSCNDTCRNTSSGDGGCTDCSGGCTESCSGSCTTECSLGCASTCQNGCAAEHVVKDVLGRVHILVRVPVPMVVKKAVKVLAKMGALECV